MAQAWRPRRHEHRCDSRRLAAAAAGLSFGAPADLAGHLEAYGPLPAPRELGARALIKLVEQSGLCGRGGAAFPDRHEDARGAGGPWPADRRRQRLRERADQRQGRAAATRAAPLVLDGAALAARAVGADEVIVAFEESNSAAQHSLEHALAERRAARSDPLRVELFVADERFLSGQRPRSYRRSTAARRSRRSLRRAQRTAACAGARR